MNVFNYNSSELLTEKDKNSEEYLKGSIDQAITELVYDKDYLRKAYNYYNCIRDKDQFRHLEENFGIGNPTAIEFIPLVKRHVDALIGELLQSKLRPKITCKDSETLSKIELESQKAVYSAELARLRQQLTTNIQGIFGQGQVDPNNPQQPPADNASEDEITKLKEITKRDFVSEFEIAAQNMIEFFIQSRDINLAGKRELLFKDILVGGQCYYKVSNKKGSPIPTLEIINPFDVFPEINVNSPYINRSRRIVYVKYMSKEEIIHEFGDDMSKDELELLHGVNLDSFSHNVFYIRSESGGLVSNVETTIPGTYPYYNDTYLGSNKYPVYYVEWLENNKIVVGDKEYYQLDRYKGARIGSEIYLNMGKDEDVVRSMEDPYGCTLSINGIQLTSRTGKPFSMVLATANLQDRYDLLHWYRDTLIANSGVKGDFMDVSTLPIFLGASPEERLLKYKAYKKQGVALYNSAQEGRGTPMNTTFAGFDDTVSGQSIQAIQLAITQTEDICSAITGVFREKLGDIEQRDAVTNVAVGMKNSAVITKQYFNTLDGVMKEALTDMLNSAKKSLKGEFKGSLILGNRLSKIFTILPEHLSFTDHDIHIGDSEQITRDIELIKNMTMELMKGGLVDPTLLFETITTESLTEFKETGLNAIKKQKEEQGVTQQLQQQVAQYTQQLKDAQGQIQKLTDQVNQKDQADLQVKQGELKMKTEQGAAKLKNDKEFKDQDLALKEKQLQAEILQLSDLNNKNDEIKNIA